MIVRVLLAFSNRCATRFGAMATVYEPSPHPSGAFGPGGALLDGAGVRYTRPHRQEEQ